MNIQKLIAGIPFLKDNISSFSLTEFKDCTKKQTMTICFELKEYISFIEMSLVQVEISKQIQSKLHLLEKDLWESGVEPVVRFFCPGSGPFQFKLNGPTS